MDDPLFDYVDELFYNAKLPPRIIPSPMKGRHLIDQRDREWFVDDESYWTNLNVSPSNQGREGLPCRVVGVVDVVKARTQIAVSKGLLPYKYHGGIVGDKLSGLDLHAKMERISSVAGGGDICEMLKRYGTTTRLEYNIRSLYTTRAMGANWLPAPLNIIGSGYQTIKDYKVCPGPNTDFNAILGQVSDLQDGPLYGSFVMHESTPGHLLRNDCLFVNTGENIEVARHGLMVYGFGMCTLVDEPWVTDFYWVARNSWGPGCPLVVRGSVGCLETMIAPFVL